MKIRQITSLWKLVYLGLVEVQTVKIIVLAYGGRVSERLTKKFKVFKGSKISGVSVFSSWAIESIRKDRNSKNFTKPCFSSKYMSGCYFRWSKPIIWMKNFQNVPSGQRFSRKQRKSLLYIEKYCLSEKHVYQTLLVLRLLFLTAGNIISQSYYTKCAYFEFINVIIRVIILH